MNYRIQNKVARLETLAGIVNKTDNPFEVKLALPYTFRDWTAEELFELFIGNKSLLNKKAQTDWTEWDDTAIKSFVRQLTDSELYRLEKKLAELIK